MTTPLPPLPEFASPEPDQQDFLSGLGEGLWRAAWRNDFDSLRELIQSGGDIDQRSTLGGTALQAAVQRQHLVVADCLLELGANPGLRNRAGLSALDVAIAHHCHFALDLLLLHKIDIKAANERGLTALHFAALFGNTYAARRLLALGVPAAATTVQGVTPLNLAVQRVEATEVAELLRGLSAPASTV